MRGKYNSIEDLRVERERLKVDIDKLENILTFKNPKESLGVMVKSYKNDGELELSRDFILGKVAEFLKLAIGGGILSKIPKARCEGDIVRYIVKLTMSYIVTNYIQKKFGKSSWRGKILGMVLIYFSPIIVEFVGQRLADCRRQKAAKSLSQLI